MGAPADVIISRHLIGHPDDTAADAARHTGLHRAVVHQVIRRLRADDALHEGRLVARIQNHPRRLHHRALAFRVPNPAQWANQFSQRFLLSGDVVAAEKDGYNVVPEKWIVYVQPQDEQAAMKAALDVFADVSPHRLANLLIRIADPWLLPDDEDPRLAERGQRLLDYDESPLLQLIGRPR
jgi:hypothetical protein